MQRSSEVQEVQWAKAYYSGEQAKHVRGLAADGIGYKILSEPSDKSVVVAFRIATNSALEPHLEIIKDPYLISKLENWRAGK